MLNCIVHYVLWLASKCRLGTVSTCYTETRNTKIDGREQPLFLLTGGKGKAAIPNTANNNKPHFGGFFHHLQFNNATEGGSENFNVSQVKGTQD